MINVFITDRFSITPEVAADTQSDVGMVVAFALPKGANLALALKQTVRVQTPAGSVEHLLVDEVKMLGDTTGTLFFKGREDRDAFPLHSIIELPL